MPLSSISDAAVFAKVAERTVKHARIVLMQATPEVQLILGFNPAFEAPDDARKAMR